MSTQAGQMRVFILQQPATAVAKDIYLNCGWRPRVAWLINYKAAGTMAIKVDALESATTEGGLVFGVNAALAEVGSDGIFFVDNGLKLGQDATLITEDAAEVVVICFRDFFEAEKIDLSTAKTRVEPYGTGKQFDKDSIGPLSDSGVSLGS